MVLIFSIEEWIWGFSTDKCTILLVHDLKAPFFEGLPMVYKDKCYVSMLLGGNFFKKQNWLIPPCPLPLIPAIWDDFVDKPVCNL